MLRSLIHMELSSVQGDKNVSVCILLHVAIHFGKHHLLKMQAFIFNVYFWVLCQNSGVLMCVDFCLGLQFNYMNSLAAFVRVSWCSYYSNSVIQFKIKVVDTSSNSFIIRDCFSFLVSFLLFFLFLYETENCPLKVCEELR